MSKEEKKYWLKKYLLDMFERVLCTFAEALLGAIGACATFGEVNWGIALSTAGFASLITVLKCLAAKKTGDTDTASLVD